MSTSTSASTRDAIVGTAAGYGVGGRSARRRKVMAVLAAGLVLGTGATVTLAVWNDSEWVAGGVDSDGDGIADAPGVGTSAFEVQQNTSAPYDDAAFADREVGPGGSLDFTLDALSLSPGDAVFAPVSLTSTVDSIAAAAIDLSGAIPSAGILTEDLDGLLFGALTLRVVTTTSVDAATPAACNAASFTGAAQYVVGSATVAAPLATAGAIATNLAAAGADKQDFCFEVSLPAGSSTALQGRQVAPAWQFVITSAA